MCGIHLIIDKNSKLSDVDPIIKMMRSTTYRGPDQEANLSIKDPITNQNLLFACNQLQITDVSEYSNQPYTNSKSNNILLFNGEIYNYLDLKNRLLKNQDLKSQSDTEVLYHVLEQQDSKSLKLLNGMFALCFYSENENKIIIARDPAGIKPLYYFDGEDYLIVSSEIKGIISSGLIKSEINEMAIGEYLQFRHCQFPNTFYKDVYELSPGHMLEYKLNEKSSSKQVLSTAADEPGKGFSVNETDRALREATSRHLMGIDTPALCLSGGVDSTLLLAKINEIQNDSFPVYCSKFGSDGRNTDFEYARKAAKVFNADFHFHHVDESCLERFDEFIDHIDQPIGDSGAFATMLLTEEISKFHKSALSGAGADELFAGYNRYLFYLEYLNHPKGFSSANRLVGSLTKSISPRNEYFRLLSKLSESIGNSPHDTYKRIVSFTRINTEHDLPDWGKSKDSKHNLLEALKYDRNRYLVSDILAMSDKMSMKNSVEMRTPYLDHELVQAVKSLDPTFILKNGRKWILKSLLKKHPKTSSFIQRRKQGYGLPFDQWVSLNPNNIFGFLEKKDHYIFQFVDRQLIYDLYKDHTKGRKNNVLELWNIVVIARWLERQCNK